jgi:AraC-like DNA-binding protein
MPHVDLGGLWHEAAFRLVETYDVELERGWRIDLDPQPYGEVVQVISGVCRFSLGNRHQDVVPGEIGVLLPGPARVTADVGPADREPLRLKGFGFRVQLFGSIELSGLLGLPLVVERPWPALLERIDETVRWGASDGTAEAFRARANAELATATLVERLGRVRAPEPVGSIGGVRREVTDALALMDADPGRAPDLAGLAAAVHLSPKHFARLFKDVVGVPPMAYRQALRVSRARALLAAGDQPVAAVAAELGFADAAHLSRAFRQAYGSTPTDFRARARMSVPSRLGSPSGSSDRSSGSSPRAMAG